VITTALGEEAKAVVSHLENHWFERFKAQDIRTYHCVFVPIQGTNSEYRIAFTQLPRIGELSASNAVTDTLVCWNPRFVLMVGIGGGNPQVDLDLGDMVVGTHDVGYDYGKVPECGIKPHDRVYPASRLLLDGVHNFRGQVGRTRSTTPVQGTRYALHLSVSLALLHQGTRWLPRPSSGNNSQRGGPS